MTYPRAKRNFMAQKEAVVSDSLFFHIPGSFNYLASEESTVRLLVTVKTLDTPSAAIRIRFLSDSL